MHIYRLVQLIQDGYLHLEHRVYIVNLLGGLLKRSSLLMQIIHGELKPGLNICHLHYILLQGQYHLIMLPNGVQDNLLGHILFVHMGLTLELLLDAPYFQVQLKYQDLNSRQYEGTKSLSLRKTLH